MRISRWLRPLPWAVAAWVAYWCLLFVLTHIPSLPSFGAPRHTDKLAHLGGYAGLAFLAAAVVMRRSRWSFNSALALLAGAMTYGVIDELMQIPIPGRTASFADWVCDCLGAAAGLAAFRIAQKALAIRREASESSPCRLYLPAEAGGFGGE